MMPTDKKALRIYIDSVTDSKVTDKANELGVSKAEYVRQLIAADLGIEIEIGKHGAHLAGEANYHNLSTFRCLWCAHEWRSATVHECPRCSEDEIERLD